jgi:hypothetical protein
MRDFNDSAAKATSVVFHPLFMPLYGLAIVFSAPTLYGYLPFGVKKLLFLIVLVNNVVLPLALLPFFKYRNIISTWKIEERSERIIPLLFTTILYSTTSFIVFKFPIPLFLKSFIFGAFFLSLSVTVVSLWWKISIHSVGAGALIALVLILSAKMHTPLIWYLVSALIAAGGVLSSRLRLNSHNSLQVWLGFTAGFMGLILFMLFF